MNWIALKHWRIFEVTSMAWPGKTTRHFVGFDLNQNSGRVSTPIKEFENILMTGRTTSGRLYYLIGSSEFNEEAELIWESFKNFNQVLEFKDVSNEYR